MKAQAIIVAAGFGVRLKCSQPKVLVYLQHKPILAYTLEAFEQSTSVKNIVVVAPKDYLAEFKNIIAQYQISKVSGIVAGGATRAESVRSGLKALDKKIDLVAIHDGARPLVSPRIIEHTIEAAQKYDAAIAAVPVKSTIKSIDSKTMTVKETLNRRDLWEIQTPQVFKRELIIRAHKEVKVDDPSDDAMLVEKLGIRIKIITGDYKNIKITTEDDLIIAEAFLTSQGAHI